MLSQFCRGNRYLDRPVKEALIHSEGVIDNIKENSISDRAGPVPTVHTRVKQNERDCEGGGYQRTLILNQASI